MTLEFEREDAVQKLCAAYARDHITTGELESRLERVYKASDRAQLTTLLEGLPAIQVQRLGDAPAGITSVPTPRSPVQLDSERGQGLRAGEKRYAAFMSEIRKEGAWTPSPVILAKTIMGSVVLDFREAQIPAEGIDIYADVFMGDLKIILPPGLPADVDCSTFMGSVNDKSKAGVPGAPLVRVNGSTFMGGISVVTKAPRREGESAFRAQMRSWLGSGE
jgi:hypothetical protein